MGILSKTVGRLASRRLGLFARFSRDRSGSAAIEFAALAIPFALLIFAILESCISFAGQEVMANATDNVARQLRTGQLKPPFDSDKLKQEICKNMAIMVTDGCPGLVVDLRTYDAFSDAASAGFTIQDGKIVLTKNGVPDTGGFVVQPGAAGKKNVLRVFYKWPVMTDFMSKSMANLDGGATLHFASAVWQNEAFDK